MDQITINRCKMEKIFEKQSQLNDSKPREVKMNVNRATSIARKFLEQYHSPAIFKSAYHDKKTWRISMEVGLLKDDVIEVVVDATSGKILGYDHLMRDH